MTEQECINLIKRTMPNGNSAIDIQLAGALEMAIKALEEIQQYRALGTVEELRVARDKQIEKKPIYKEMPYSEEVGFNEEWHCPVCGAYIGYCTEGMSEPEQMEYCNECGQHIAKDWSDEDE